MAILSSTGGDSHDVIQLFPPGTTPVPENQGRKKGMNTLLRHNPSLARDIMANVAKEPPS